MRTEGAMPLFLGLDLTGEYIAVCAQDGEPVLFPAAVCRDRVSGFWSIGEEAYRMALDGSGVLKDGLLKLLEKDSAPEGEDGNRNTDAEELTAVLIRRAVTEALRIPDLSSVDRAVLTVRRPEKKLMDRLLISMELAGIPRGRAAVTGHEEAFARYTLSRDKEIYSSAAALFDLTEEALAVYELQMIRGGKQRIAAASGRELKEAFRPEILKKETGRSLGDRILTDAAEKLLDGRLFSAVLLTGSGFEQTDWAPEFLNCICRRRRVLQESGLFAIGAEKAAEDGEKLPEGCLLLCDSRIASEISLEVTVQEKTSRLILASPGDCWHGLQIRAELMPAGQQHLDLQTESAVGNREKHTVRIPLTGFPERPDRTTRIALELSFRSAETAEVKITDLGFGELFPASGAFVTEEIRL